MARTQPLTAVKIGNNNTTETADVSNRGCRTQAQYDAVIAYHRDREPSAWWAGNPFESTDGKKYRCGFMHSYFSFDGHFRAVWVDEKGRIDGGYGRDDDPKFAGETRAVAEKYGVFMGGE